MSWEKILDKYSNLMSYYNFVEFVVPAAASIGIVYADFRIVLSKNLWPKDLSISTPFIVLGLLMLIGWFIYTSRFYHLFPGYSKFKKNSLTAISQLFPEMNIGYNTTQLGKYVFRIYWKIVTGDEKKEALRLHVNWVFLVHICNVIMISALFIIMLYIYHAVAIGIWLPTKETTTLFVAHLPIYIFLRRAAIHNLNRSNFNLLDNINSKRVDIKKEFPKNLKELLKVGKL